MNGFFNNVGWVWRVSAVTRRTTCFSRIACADVEPLRCGSRAAGELLFFACAKKSNQKVWPRRASLRGPDIRTSMYIKAHPIARRAEQRAVPCAPRLSRVLRDVHGCYECHESAWMRVAANSHESKTTIRAQTVLAQNPGLSCGARRARLAPGRGEKRRGFRRLRGVLSLGYLSLHEQRKVTRRRAASGTIAFQRPRSGLNRRRRFNSDRGHKAAPTRPPSP